MEFLRSGVALPSIVWHLRGITPPFPPDRVPVGALACPALRFARVNGQAGHATRRVCDRLQGPASGEQAFERFDAERLQGGVAVGGQLVGLRAPFLR